MGQVGLWMELGLFAAAFCAGVVNSIAGGGTLLTFPSLLAAGLPAVTANATSTVALVPGSMSAFWGYRNEIAGEGRLLAAMAVPSIIGGVIGALTADRVGDATFAKLAPLLVLGATVLFMSQEPLRVWARRIANPDGDRRQLGHLAAVSGFQLLVALYGGFFGAGIGILMLASLALLGLTDIHRMNGLKNLAAVCINGLAAITFALAGRVDWPVALLMMAGGVLGGFFGARMAKRLGQVVVRRLVVAIGLTISAVLAVRLALAA
ncbi:MAG TPA: sulfite exporter TauE/SafE family protein [Myxococcota bacterium]|nr:sulfite exporter TauE/SafE family protein [Myxococcota bacterium]